MSKLGTRRNDREPGAILFAGLSGAVTPGAGANIDFDTVITESDDASELSLDTVTNVGRITVSGGNVYELDSQVDPSWISGVLPVTIQWRDITAGAYVGKQGIYYNQGATGGTETQQCNAKAVVAPNSSNAYELWVVTTGAVMVQEAGTNAWITVRKL